MCLGACTNGYIQDGEPRMLPRYQKLVGNGQGITEVKMYPKKEHIAIQTASYSPERVPALALPRKWLLQHLDLESEPSWTGRERGGGCGDACVHVPDTKVLGLYPAQTLHAPLSSHPALF